MTDLVLNSLEVRNFRAFRHLNIERLGRVNLITGKNNVGKSSLLEALWLYAHRGFPLYIWEVLRGRNESPRPRTNRLRLNFTEGQEGAIKFLFHGRRNVREKSVAITIGPIGSPKEQLSLAIQWYVEDEDDEGDTVYRPITLGQLAEAENSVLRLRVKIGSQPPTSYPLDRNPSTLVNKSKSRDIHSVFSTANGLDFEAIGNFWDRIALSDLENDVLLGLRIITENVNGISLVSSQENAGERIAIVKLKSLDDPIPLRSLGEGMNRMFGIVLALVNSKDGLLLIDEVDTGLHYSVLPNVWKLIFEIANRLNVQVFATTHNWDCIQAFQRAASDNVEVAGQLIRLTNKNGEVVSDIFSEQDLEIVTESAIEVR